MEKVYKKPRNEVSFNDSFVYVERNCYQSPLAYRYGSEEMSYNFSQLKKYSIWRWLWVYLAKAQRELGLDISEEMINEMQEHIEDIDFDYIEEEEKKNKHDVLAHIKEFATKCPKSAHIIHLGASSFFVGDNTDLIVIRDAFDNLLPKISSCLESLCSLAKKYAALPALGYTHLQPVGVITMGKRICLWINDLLMDLNAMQRVRNELKFRGCKGHTGTQSSFLQLFGGDKEKVKKLDERVTQLAGFKQSYSICGPTYSRKVDCECLSVLANFGVSVNKMCTDIRLLCSFGQVEEPEGSLEDKQVAQHKLNPLKSERCCSLSRTLWSMASNALQSASMQWLERTMDDSLVRRITIPEAFLTADVILQCLQNLCNGLVIRSAIINRQLKQELPFFINSQIVDAMREKGVNTELTFKHLKKLQQETTISLKEKGEHIDLEKIIREDQFFVPIQDQFDALFNPLNHIGCAEEQVNDFIQYEVLPLLAQLPA